MAKLSSKDIKILLNLKSIPEFKSFSKVTSSYNFKIGDWKRIRKYNTSKGIRRIFTKEHTPFIAYVDELKNGEIDILIRLANDFEVLMISDTLSSKYYHNGCIAEDISLNYNLDDAYELSEGLLPEEFEFALHVDGDELTIFVQPIHVKGYDQEIYYITPLFGGLTDGEATECHFTLTDKAVKTKSEAIKNLTALGFNYSPSLLDGSDGDDEEYDAEVD